MITCKHCNKPIKDKEVSVNYSETRKTPKKTLIDLHFHQKCWIENYNESLDRKIRIYSENILKTAMPLIQETMSGGKVVKI